MTRFSSVHNDPDQNQQQPLVGKLRVESGGERVSASSRMSFEIVDLCNPTNDWNHILTGIKDFPIKITFIISNQKTIAHLKSQLTTPRQ